MGQFSVRKADVLRAARNAKRSIIKYRMWCLRRTAVECLEPLRVTVFLRKAFGLSPIPAPTEREIREEMRQLWHTGNSRPIVDYRIASWGTLGTAEELIAACRACCGETVMLDTEDAAFVSRYL